MASLLRPLLSGCETISRGHSTFRIRYVPEGWRVKAADGSVSNSGGRNRWTHVSCGSIRVCMSVSRGNWLRRVSSVVRTMKLIDTNDNTNNTVSPTKIFTTPQEVIERGLAHRGCHTKWIFYLASLRQLNMRHEGNAKHRGESSGLTKMNITKRGGFLRCPSTTTHRGRCQIYSSYYLTPLPSHRSTSRVRNI